MTSSNAEAAIVVSGLGKTYPSVRGTSGLVRRLLGREHRQPGTSALRDVEFEVPRGSVLGIIGRNGSGKSTLLRILAGGLSPSSGEFRVHGRIGSLLDLTSGISPEFTGRENALILGILGGMSRAEIAGALERVQVFSGLGEAFDHPIKSYSSGMVLRLAFSAAVHASPDVLLIDEALAVGDAFFQQRCLRRIREFRSSGRTIVLVSHDTSAILSLADRALWLEGGRMAAYGEPDRIVRQYLAARYRDDCSLDSVLVTEPPDLEALETAELQPAENLSHSDERFGNGHAVVLGAEVRDAQGHPISFARAGEFVRVVVTSEARDALKAPLVGFSLRNRLGEILTATNNAHENRALPALEPGDRITVEFRFLWPEFSSGTFTISPAIANGTVETHQMCDWVENAEIFDGQNPRGLFGPFSLPGVEVHVSRVTGTRSSA